MGVGGLCLTLSYMPLAEAIATGTAAAATAIGAGITNHINRKNSNKVIQKNRKCQNAYTTRILDWNTPKNQLSRMKNAHLNPYLMYGNGGVENTASSINTSQGKPYTNAENPMAYDVSNGFANFTQGVLNQKTSEKTAAETEGQKIANDRFNEQIDAEMEKLRADTAQIEANTSLTEEQIQLTKEQRVGQAKDNLIKQWMLDYQLPADYEKTLHEIFNIDAQTGKLNWETTKIEEYLKNGEFLMKFPKSVREEVSGLVNDLLKEFKGAYEKSKQSKKSEEGVLDKCASGEYGVSGLLLSLLSSGSSYVSSALSKSGNAYSDYQRGLYTK